MDKNNNNINFDEVLNDAPKEKVIQTDTDSKNGQNKCPRCGATDIETNLNTGKLRCNFCRNEFEVEKMVMGVEDIDNLEGIVISSGAQNIIADTDEVLTLKCESCGAEVVIDTASSTQARCHWCRNTLSINKQIPNGAVPDAVLPFGIKREEAEQEIAKFVNKRKFFAHPTFTKEFSLENVNGVYFPYMVVDVNAHANYSGKGEEEIRRYTIGSDDDKETVYDADLYYIEREFDITINDLTIESSSDKLDVNSKSKTTNIINSIMPFDTENCVKYDSNYLKGYTSEKRDTDITVLQPIAHAQSSDIAKFAANDTLEKYDRGVAWDVEDVEVKGEAWTSTYLPVWLYSYMQKKGKDNVLHYVAVNARTKETMGSVPINKTRLILVSIIVEFFGGLLAFLINLGLHRSNSESSNYVWLLLLSGVVFYSVMYMRYRNSNARHTYEYETDRTVKNMREVDEYIERRTRLRNKKMYGANNTILEGNLNNFKGSDEIKKLAKMGVNLDDVVKMASKLDNDDDDDTIAY